MKLKEKQKAIELRSLGWSIKRIAKELNVSKSSVSLWVRGVILNKKYQKVLKENGEFDRKILLNSLAERHRDNRKKWRLDGFNLASSDELFRIICSLYWGEGSKTQCSFVICNDDVDMLKLVCNWLRKKCLFEKVKFVARYHPNNGLSETEIKQYWVEKLGLSVFQLLKFGTYKSKNNSKKHKCVLYGNGTIIINSVELLENVLGGIDYLRAHSEVVFTPA